MAKIKVSDASAKSLSRAIFLRCGLCCAAIDPRASAALIEKEIATGRWASIAVHWSNTLANFTAFFIPRGENVVAASEWTVAFGDTAQLAIARVFLLANGVEEVEAVDDGESPD